MYASAVMCGVICARLYYTRNLYVALFYRRAKLHVSVRSNPQPTRRMLSPSHIVQRWSLIWEAAELLLGVASAYTLQGSVVRKYGFLAYFARVRHSMRVGFLFWWWGDEQVKILDKFWMQVPPGFCPASILVSTNVAFLLPNGIVKCCNLVSSGPGEKFSRMWPLRRVRGWSSRWAESTAGSWVRRSR